MHKYFIFLTVIVICSGCYAAAAEDKAAPHGMIVKNVLSEGSCAVLEMSAGQCQMLALQRARASAIEQASGVRVSSSTLVTNGMLAVDFIKTYSKGFIIGERVEWLPLGQYQKDKSTPPIPEYTVKIIADVYVPGNKQKPIYLSAKINNAFFKNGEKARIDIVSGEKARIAIFNITADDRVVMLFPNDYEKDNKINENSMFKFPSDGSKVELLMQTLPGHKRDAEAFFISAMDADYGKNFTDIFTPLNSMSLDEFFKTYSGIADFCEDVILTYEVIDGKGN